MIGDISLLPLSAAILSASLVVTAGLAPRRRTLAGLMFLGLNVATFLWSIAYFAQLNWGRYADPALAPYGTPDYLLVWITSLGVAGAPTYWFLFAAADARSPFWTSRSGILLAHVPLAYTIAVSVTNPSHHLFLAQGSDGMQRYGPLAIPHFIGTFVLVIAGMVMLVSRPLSSGTAAGRRKGVMLAIASMMPLAGGLFFAYRLLAGNPLPINPTPVLFPVLGLVLAYQVMRGELGDIVPLSTLSAIMENTDAHLAFLDPDCLIVSANSAFVRRSGHSEQELLGHSYFDFFPDPSRRELFDGVRATGRQIERHADIGVFRDHSPLAVSYWDWSLTPVRDSSGEMQGLVLSALDVTEAVREQHLSQTLNALSSRIHAEFASDDVLCSVVADAAAALGCDSSAVVVDRDDTWMIMQQCEQPEAVWEPFSAQDFPHVALALRTGETLGIEDALNDERLNRYMMKALRLRAALVVPMPADSRASGALVFVIHSQPMRFSAAQIDFAERLTSVIALALENARMYESERQIAQTLQESMLNVPRRIPGIEFEHVYHSASESARVGGDFYDLFEIDDRRIGILIGDVSGKGIGAAVTTSLVKNAVRASAYQDPAPAGVLEKTGDVLRRQTEPEIFATAFFAVLDPGTGDLRYCGAGHPPSVLARRSGEVQLLESTSPLLGAFSGASYAQDEVALEEGDTLLLYTDGVTEARNEGGMLGEDGLTSIVTHAEDKRPAAIVRTVFDSVMAFTGNALSDDLALLAVQRRDESAAPPSCPPR